MSAVGGVGGGGLAMSLMQAMNEMSKDCRATKRDEARQEAALALHEGEAQADELRDAASTKFVAAVTGAAISIGSSAVQIGMLASAPATPEMPADLEGFSAAERASMEGAQAATRAIAQSRQAFAAAAGSAGQIASPVQAAIAAGAGDHEAAATEHGARAQAASQRASVAESDAQEATATARKAKELAQSILELAHSSRMAALKA
jgi:uncharacterized phage infection (PIP) family protein YhgE